MKNLRRCQLRNFYSEKEISILKYLIKNVIRCCMNDNEDDPNKNPNNSNQFD